MALAIFINSAFTSNIRTPIRTNIVSHVSKYFVFGWMCDKKEIITRPFLDLTKLCKRSPVLFWVIFAFTEIDTFQTIEMIEI